MAITGITIFPQFTRATTVKTYNLKKTIYPICNQKTIYLLNSAMSIKRLRNVLAIFISVRGVRSGIIIVYWHIVPKANLN